jgi:ketosteroid isomerase-like protein
VHGQIDGVEDCFALPATVATPDGVRVIRTPREVRRVFEQVRELLAKDKAVDVVRTVLESKFVSDTEIESIHISSTIKPTGEAVRSPYPVFSLLRACDDGAWRIAHCTYAIDGQKDLSEALLSWKS